MLTIRHTFPMNPKLVIGAEYGIVARESAKRIACGKVESTDSLQSLIAEFQAYCRNAPICFNARMYLDGLGTVAEWTV